MKIKGKIKCDCCGKSPATLRHKTSKDDQCLTCWKESPFGWLRLARQEIQTIQQNLTELTLTIEIAEEEFKAVLKREKKK